MLPKFFTSLRLKILLSVSLWTFSMGKYSVGLLFVLMNKYSCGLSRSRLFCVSDNFNENCTSLTHRLWLDEFLNMWHSYQNAPTWEAVCTLIPLWIRISVMGSITLVLLKNPKRLIVVKGSFFHCFKFEYHWYWITWQVVITEIPIFRMKL